MKDSYNHRINKGSQRYSRNGITGTFVDGHFYPMLAFQNIFVYL